MTPEPVPLARTWDEPGEYECYPPGTVAGLTAQRDRLLAYVRAKWLMNQCWEDPGGRCSDDEFSRRSQATDVAWRALITAGDL